MIARNVTMRLKAHSLADFTQTLEKEVIPLLRKQKGFEDEITFIGSDGQEAVGIEIGRKVALVLGDVKPAIENLYLGFPRALDQPLGREGGVAVGWRWQLAQKVGAAVVDQEEVRALRVVGAARGAAGHGEVGLGHDRLLRRRILEGPHHRTPTRLRPTR